MIQTTTPYVEGKKITDYHGVVTGEAILGAKALDQLAQSPISDPRESWRKPTCCPSTSVVPTRRRGRPRT